MLSSTELNSGGWDDVREMKWSSFPFVWLCCLVFCSDGLLKFLKWTPSSPRAVFVMDSSPTVDLCGRIIAKVSCADILEISICNFFLESQT